MVDINRRYGRLVVKGEAEDLISPSGRHSKRWVCKCDCGKDVIVHGSSLKSGNTKSCGCLRSENSSSRLRSILVKHGYSREKLYKVWKSMHRRCAAVSGKDFKNYSDKGISVCDEWNDVRVFVDWALKNGYHDGLSIDRIDSNGNYTPQNCRWVNRKVQNNNTSRNHLITYHGRTQTMAQWAEETGISYAALKSRLNRGGWSVEKSLETPVKH